MERAVAIGGGDSSNTQLEHEVARVAEKAHSHALFIPTAAGDNPRYIDWFNKTFSRFGCTTEALLMHAANPSPSDVADAIRGADIIYLGAGGDPRKVYEQIWPRFRIRELLNDARERAVLAGSSAGAMFLGTKGYGQNPGEPYLVEGLGVIPGTVCAHYDNPIRGSREAGLKTSLADGGSAFALKDSTAMIRVGDGFRIRTSDYPGGAFYLRKRGSVVESTRLLPSASYTPITSLGR